MVNNSSIVVPKCPPGFDCTFYNSCPNFILDCPDGFFCASYEGFEHEKEMDYIYALTHGYDDVTKDNADTYAAPNRAIQTRCLRSFFCDETDAMEACPADHWCSESTVEPQTCDILSYCPYFSSFQLNFVNTLIATVAVTFVLCSSYALLRQQMRKNANSQKKQPNDRNFSDEAAAIYFRMSLSSATAADADQRDQSVTTDDTRRSSLESGTSQMLINETDVVEASFCDLHYSTHGKEILPGVSGIVPGASVTVILGPSSCGKTSLLSLIRNSGAGADSGGVRIGLCTPVGSNRSQPQEHGEKGRRDDSLPPNNRNVDFVNSSVDPELFKEDDSLLCRASIPSATDIKHSAQQRKLAGESLRVIEKSRLHSFIGYVPQADIIDRQLTTRELLTFNALIRVPGLAQKDPLVVKTLVDSVLADLCIQHVADSVIGGGENVAPNISGGQLKRVNIAIELVAMSRPALLLLDEPTAGLDANIAYELMETLTLVAKKGVTILMVLQQPRVEMFDMIDHLFLMDQRGAIVYEGPVNRVVPYLEHVGYKIRSETCAADFCVDVLNGIGDTGTAVGSSTGNYTTNQQQEPPPQQPYVPPPPRPTVDTGSSAEERYIDTNSIRNSQGRDYSSSTSLQTDRLQTDRLSSNASSTPMKAAASDTNSGQYQYPPYQHHSQPLAKLWLRKRMLGSEWFTPSSQLDAIDFEGAQEIRKVSWFALDCSSKHMKRVGNKFLLEAKLNAKRLTMIRLRNRRNLLTYFFINFLMAVSLATGFSILIHDTYLAVVQPPVISQLQPYYPSVLAKWRRNNVEDLPLAQMLFFMSGSLGCASALAAVPALSGQVILLVRERTAGMSVLAYVTGRLLADLFFVTVNSSIFSGVWMLFGHAGHWYNWWAIVFGTAYAASGIGYLTAATVSVSDASLYAIILTFACCVFNGVEPTLASVKQYPVVNWPWYLSFATWTAEGVYAVWTEYLTDHGHVQQEVQEGADHYGYHVTDGVSFALSMLLLIGTAFRIATVIILHRKTR